MARTNWRELGTEPDYRFSLANERTFLAWIRTALSLMAAAVAVVQLVPSFQLPGSRTFLGVLLALTGMACASTSYLRWVANERAMRQARPLPLARGLVAVSAALSIVGLAVVMLVLFAAR